MKQKFSIKEMLLLGALAGLATNALAEMTVDQSNGVLTISSDSSGTVIAKVVGPDDEMIVDESYSGSSFSWAPSSGSDGAYRYDVRVLLEQNDSASKSVEDDPNVTQKSDYAGGSVEVKDGQITNPAEAIQ